MAIRLLTKEQMIGRLRAVQNMGWIRSLRPLNSGGIGNTVDDLLGFPENNLPIADSAQWELKTHREGSQSLLTLFHMEPEPREPSVVPRLLLPNYGWPHRRLTGELSFRQTLRATQVTDRGFSASVNRATERIVVGFDATKVHPRHAAWLQSVEHRVGLGPLIPQPYWEFRDLLLKASTKLLNFFYIHVQTRKEKSEEYFAVSRILVLQGLDIDRFISAIEEGAALIDFDARSTKNHGTKFRLRQDWVPNLYRYVDVVS